ncbi:MAG: YcgN family cysteine cluster protein [Rhodospirillaceae bacterium]|nr:YcgN family cysteine cluster protein [Rhodospirillaceae bacterium]
MADQPFWEKPLDQLSDGEWEALCDGCGKCCLVKLRDEVTDQLYFTDVACRLLDRTSCRCGDYANRRTHVPDCVVLKPGSIGDLDWLPSTCAYRLRAAGEALPWWHPLVSGDPETVHLVAMSVRDRIVSEDEVDEDDMEDHIARWPEPEAYPVPRLRSRRPGRSRKAG